MNTLWNRTSLKTHDKLKCTCIENMGDRLNQYPHLQLKTQNKTHSSKLSFQKLLKTERPIVDPGKMNH